MDSIDERGGKNVDGNFSRGGIHDKVIMACWQIRYRRRSQGCQLPREGKECKV